MLRFLNKIRIVALAKGSRQKSSQMLVSSLRYNRFGDPTRVLSLDDHLIDDPDDNEILVKMLASPINQADIHIIQGKYPVDPGFPAIGGNEFVGEILLVGRNVKEFKKGDWVVPTNSNPGSWTTEAKFGDWQLRKVSKKFGLPEALAMPIICTAYRLLSDFMELEPGDTVIQNAANGSVGQVVHQLCKAWKLSSVGVVRYRPDISKLKEYLKELGATEVLTEKELLTTDIFKSKLKRPELALDGVGGESAGQICRHLRSECSTMVTYGGMSNKPIIVPTGALIFNDLTFRGFLMTRWNEDPFNVGNKYRMFNELNKLMETRQLKAPVHKLIPFKKFKDGIEDTLKGYNGKKLILDIDDF